MSLIDAYHENNDPKYENSKYKKRISMIFFSVFFSLFCGAAPLFGWSQMDYEPSRLSCSVYDYKGSTAYTSYIFFIMIFYEIAPFFIVIFCKILSNIKL